VNKLILITGPQGCGKSAIAGYLGNEMPIGSMSASQQRSLMKFLARNSDELLVVVTCSIALSGADIDALRGIACGDTREFYWLTCNNTNVKVAS
jgi:gluconate kinase